MSECLVVIDTQSLLDWLVFQDPACAGWDDVLRPGEPLAEPALTSQSIAPERPPRWTWVATAAMKAEFDHVLARGLVARRPWSAEVLASAWSCGATLVDPPPALPPTVRLQCSDPDDQKFIDLALARGPCHLVTRDKALLKLARRAAERRGVRICTPVGWNQVRSTARMTD